MIPGLGRFSGEGNSYPLQYSGLENSMDCIVHEVINSWTQLSDYMLLKGNSAIFFFQFFVNVYIFWQMYPKYLENYLAHARAHGIESGT